MHADVHAYIHMCTYNKCVQITTPKPASKRNALRVVHTSRIRIRI